MSRQRPNSADHQYALTSNFMSISRDEKPSWGNRFIRDNYDLMYDADPHSISKQIKPKPKYSKNAENQEQQIIAKKYQYSPLKQKQSTNLKKSLKVEQYIASVQQLQKAKRNYQTTATTSRKTRFHQDNSSVRPFDQKTPNQPSTQQVQRTQNRQGLSRFEYSATIEGQLTKSNHHLDFNRNKTNKIDNVNKIWYDKSKDIVPKHRDLEKKRQIQRVHQFKSYSPHQLFHRTKKMLEDNGSGCGGMLDKFYQVSSPQKYNVTHKRTLTGTPNIRCMSARPDIPKKLGTNLEYKIQKMHTVGVGNSKKPVMHMSSSARKLVFNRQVISPARGCYR